MTKQQLFECLDQIEIDTGFIKLVRLLERQKVNLSVVSDGLDLVIQYILEKNQLDHLPIIANHLDHLTANHWQLSFPYSDNVCSSQSGTCKCKIAKLNRQEKIILIGDGRSDFCLAERADYVFAKKSLIEHCTSKKIHHHPFDEFSQIIEPLFALLNSSSEAFEATELWVNS